MRAAALAAAFAGGTAAAGRLSIRAPGTPVPITGQSLAALWGGIALGPGPTAVGGVLYAALAAAGVEPFAPSHRLAGGYIAGFLAAAPVLGRHAARGRIRTARQAAAASLVGHAVILAAGATWMAVDGPMGAGEAWRRGVRPFLPGALVKTAVLAAGVPLAPRPAEV